MPSLQAAQLIASAAVGVLLGLIAGGTLRVPVGSALTGAGDSLLLGLFALAAFSLGVFLAWLVLSF